MTEVVIGTADLAEIAERLTVNGTGWEEHEAGMLVPWPHTAESLKRLSLIYWQVYQAFREEMARLWS